MGNNCCKGDTKVPEYPEDTLKMSVANDHIT